MWVCELICVYDVYAWMGMYIMYVCICILVYMYVFWCRVCVFGVRMSSVCSCKFMCLVVWHSVSDLFGKIRTRCKRFRFVLVMDSMGWRSEDRPMRWSRDSYRFVQWRPDDDSDLKSRHFMWVFVYWSISISVFLPYVSYECTYYFVLFSSCRQILLYHDALILFYRYIVTLLPTLLLFCSGILS